MGWDTRTAVTKFTVFWAAYSIYVGRVTGLFCEDIKVEKNETNESASLHAMYD
jgi:hypothetical protein